MAININWIDMDDFIWDKTSDIKTTTKSTYGSWEAKDLDDYFYKVMTTYIEPEIKKVEIVPLTSLPDF